jgi:hypothetical protein
MMATSMTTLNVSHEVDHGQQYRQGGTDDGCHRRPFGVGHHADTRNREEDGCAPIPWLM